MYFRGLQILKYMKGKVMVQPCNSVIYSFIVLSDYMMHMTRFVRVTSCMTQLSQHNKHMVSIQIVVILQ